MRRCCKHNIRTKKNYSSSWSGQEDLQLTDCVNLHGVRVPQFAGLLRCAKCCRVRRMSHLRPYINIRDFGEDEEDLIIRLYALLGNRWSLIAGRLPGRMDHEVKDHWHSHIKKKLMKMGADPNKHGLKLYPLATFTCNEIPKQRGNHMQDESSEFSGPPDEADSQSECSSKLMNIGRATELASSFSSSPHSGDKAKSGSLNKKKGDHNS